MITQEFIKQAAAEKVAQAVPAKGPKTFNFKNIGYGLAVGTALVGATRLVDEIIDYLKEMRVQSKSKDYYQKMLDEHPELKKQDPKLVAKYWASLYHYAPYIAQEPLTAGAYIRQSLDRAYAYGGPGPDVVSTLANVNKSMNDVRGKKTQSYGRRLSETLGNGIALGSMDSTLTPEPII